MQQPLKRRVIVSVASILAITAAVPTLALWWGHAYSRGIRSGTIRALSVKKAGLCTYLDGEMTMIGDGPSSRPWEFSVDDDDADNPLVARLRRAQETGARVTLEYRQDRSPWNRCAPLEYFVTGME